MDKEKSPEIRIEGINLLTCNVAHCDNPPKELSYNLGLTKVERTISENQETLIYFLSFDLLKGITPAPFKFNFDFLITYARDKNANMTWDEFKDVNALTHVIPYIREFIVNITSRMLVPPLIIPPINVFALLDEYNNSMTESTGQENNNSE